MSVIPAYVYLVTHKPTGKFYYGSRYRHIYHNIMPVDDLWQKYFTSSKEVSALIASTGLNSFDYQIIFTDVNSSICFEHEQQLIKEHIADPRCINKRYFDSVAGSKIYCTFGKTLSSKGRPKSEETKHRMRKPKSIEHRQAMSKSQTENGGNGPVKHSEETKNKIRKAMQLATRENKICPHCGKEGGFLSMSRWHFNNCKFKEV